MPTRAHRTLARRQALRALPRQPLFGGRRTGLGIPLQRGSNRRQQAIALDRLQQEIDGTALHRFDRGRNVAVAGQEHDRSPRSAGIQPLLQRQPVDAGQREIQHWAAGVRRVAPLDTWDRSECRAVHVFSVAGTALDPKGPVARRPRTRATLGRTGNATQVAVARRGLHRAAVPRGPRP
jgi:hypothetical protein